MNNNRIKNTLIACFAKCKKALVSGFAMTIAANLIAFSLLPLAVQAASPNMVEVLVKVNREVVKLPDLYERLTLNLKTAANPAGLGAVEVLNIKMNLLGNEPISIGKYSGPDLYIFFTVTFDGPESTNAYQASAVSTSYEIFSKSEKKLNIFKIISTQGDVFKDMKNLNPGDIKEGVIHIDPLSFEPIESTTGQPTTTVVPTTIKEQTTGKPPGTSAPTPGTQPTNGQQPGTDYSSPGKEPITGQQPGTDYPSPGKEPITDQLPITDDPTPVKPLIYLSVGLTTLLCVQIVVYAKRKRKEKTDI